MVDSFNSLRHNAVVGRYYQNSNIGNGSAASSHLSESFMTRGIDEGNLLAVVSDCVSTDSLSNTTSFAGNYGSTADSVQKGSLTVVYVT